MIDRKLGGSCGPDNLQLRAAKINLSLNCYAYLNTLVQVSHRLGLA